MDSLNTFYLLAGIVVGLVSLGALLYSVWKLLRWLVRCSDLLNGNDEKPGLEKRLESFDHRLAKSAAEFAEIKRHLAKQDAHLAQQDTLLAEQARTLQAIKAEVPKNGSPLASKIDAIVKHFGIEVPNPNGKS